MIKHIGKIFDKEYDIPYSNNNDIVILDIGANIGGFARWAKYRWPNSQIWCYEPIKSNYKLLIKNTSDLETVHCHNLAVGEKKEKRQMYYGANNLGEASFYLGKEQKDEGEIVSVFPAQDLPKAHIVKIDTEGAEKEILTNIKFLPDVFLIEFHSAEKRKFIDKYLDVYTLTQCNMRDHNYGVLKYVRTELLNEQ